MRAHEIMTAKVHTISPDTGVGDIARLMASERISGVPVVSEDGSLLGIVSESDLLHRAETGTEKTRKWWIALFLDADTRARDFIKCHAHKASDIMCRYVISVDDNAKLSEVADILDTNNLKRVPVLKAGRMVGIITRGDLVRALANADATTSGQVADAAELQKALNERIGKQNWLNPAYINVVVTDRSVELWGLVGSHDQHKALLILAEETAGARHIDDHLVVGPHRPSVAA